MLISLPKYHQRLPVRELKTRALSKRKEANSWGKRPPPYTAPLPATKVPEEKPEALLFCQDIQLSCHQTCLACGPEGRWEKEPGEDQDRHSLDGVGYPLQGF